MASPVLGDPLESARTAEWAAEGPGALPDADRVPEADLEGVTAYARQQRGRGWSDGGFIAISKRQRQDTTLLAAARHNKRAIPAEHSALHIDQSRSHRNFALRGPATAEEVDALAKRLMAEAGITKPRKGAVIFIEIVFSLPPETPIDPRAYFEECTQWAERNFLCPLLASDVHLDEANPHCHVLLLPLKDGHLIGSELVSYGPTFRARLDSFYEEVANPFDLRRPPAALKGTRKANAAHQVLHTLNATQDGALRSKVWPAIRRAIEGNPRPFMAPLGIELTNEPKRQRTFAQIMTSPGRGPRWEPDFVPRFDANGSTPLLGEAAPADTLLLSCVGEAPSHCLPPDASVATSPPDTLDRQQPRHAD